MEELQMVIIEDESDIAQSIPSHLGVAEKYIDRTTFITDEDQLLDFLLNTESTRVFIVDINLGIGREADGVVMIKIIRKESPDALIIVYTANGDKAECLNAGADYFYLKEPADIEKTFESINANIENYLKDKNWPYGPVVSYYSSVINISEKSVFFECYYEKEIIEWELDINVFPNAAKLTTSCKFKVTIVKKPKGYCTNFEKITQIPDNIRTSFDDDENDDFLMSDMWTNKPS